MSDASKHTQEFLEHSTLKWRRRALLAAALLGLCGLVWIMGYLLEVLATPVGILVCCLILVFILNPLVEFFEKRGLGRFWGTLLAFVVLVLVLALLVWIMFAPGIGASAQFVTLAESLPGYAQTFSDGLRTLTDRYSDILQNETVQGWIAQASESLSGFLGNFASTAGTGIVSLGGAVANTAMVIGFGSIIAFWLLMELPGLEREVRRLISPAFIPDYELFTTTITAVMGGYLKATIIQCVIIGAGCGIAYAIMGLPGPAALGIITGLLNIIPVVGPWLGGGVAALVGFTVSPIMAMVAIVVAVVIQQVVYTFISPMLMSDSVDIHPALVIFGLMCGSAIGGAMAGLGGSIAGMLASIPLIAAAKTLFVYYYERNTGRRIVSPDGVFFKGAVPEDENAEVDPTMDAAAPMPSPPRAPLPILKSDD